MPDSEHPKLIIDSDWKSQAQAEKEKLAAAAKPKDEPKGSGRGAAAGEAAKFEDLLSLLVSQALAYMGAFPDPRTGQAVVALDLAKLHIDLLGVLEEKTKGNLAEQEAQMLSRTLHELRLEFVDLSKALAKAVEEGRVSPRGAGVPPAAGGPGLVTPGQG